MSYILVTGGAGFIGSHTVLALNEAGFKPVIFDNLSNGHKDTVGDFPLIVGDLRDKHAIDQAFKTYPFQAIIHFAALIEAGISVQDPFAFYETNIIGSLNLLEAMRAHKIKDIVFSSTAAVYKSKDASLTEDDPKEPANPYGQTKWAVEAMLKDSAQAYGLRAVALRYFNAAGADPHGRLGERHEPETHLIPLVIQAALGKRDHVKLYGTDYDTPDGSCIRDYVHVSDLADAHVKALVWLLRQTNRDATGLFQALNLGTGQGHSVRAVIDCVRRISGCDFKVEIAARRAGDAPRLVANSQAAQKLLDWHPQHTILDDMVRHAYDFLKGRGE